jgi:hypothetical protein
MHWVDTESENPEIGIQITKTKDVKSAIFIIDFGEKIATRGDGFVAVPNEPSKVISYSLQTAEAHN